MIDTRQSRTLTSLPRAQGVVSVMFRVLGTWSTRRHQRRSLARLDAHLLRDIGLDEATARNEALKHFWLE